VDLQCFVFTVIFLLACTGDCFGLFAKDTDVYFKVNDLKYAVICTVAFAVYPASYVDGNLVVDVYF